MFDLPDAKRIRRADLNRSGSSSPAHSEFGDSQKLNQRSKDEEDKVRTALLQAKLAALLGPVEFDTRAPVPQHSDGLHKGGGEKGSKSETLDSSGRKKKLENIGQERDVDLDMDIDMEQDARANQDSNLDSDSSSFQNSRGSTPPADHSNPTTDPPEEQEYDFLLFHNPSNQPSQSQKIILSTSDEPTGTGRILRSRPREFYIVPKATGEKRERFQEVAVSGEDVLSGRSKRHWGLEVRWRVSVLTNDGKLVPYSSIRSDEDPSSGSSISRPAEAEGSASQEKAGGLPNTKSLGAKTKTKPNKKRRILLREKRRKREAVEEVRKKEKERKEEEEREKKTRRNREKKVKRRLKEKAKKAETGTIGHGEDAAAGGGGGGEEGDDRSGQGTTRGGVNGGGALKG